MSIFNKLFGKKKPSKPTPTASTSFNLANDPNLVRAFDAYGRELFITKKEWRTNVLPENIKSNWNNPDALYNVIVAALTDGFRAEVIEAASHLYEIDPHPDRGTCIWGIVLMEENRLDEAERVFRNFLDERGAEGIILTNLAKVYSKRNDNPKAEEILWQALEHDPNQDNGLMWYYAIHRERSGDAGGLDAFRRVAAVPGSWRPQLWLARHYLELRDINEAVGLYREALDRASQPPPSDLLMQMSGDLGNAGQIETLLELVEPRFDTHQHGLLVGNNLIKANLTLGRIDRAEQILNSLFAENRMDWKETLSFWDTEIAKAKTANSSITPDSLSAGIYALEGPIWLKTTSPACEIFQLQYSESPAIAFLGSSAETSRNPDNIEVQLADTPGRLSRGLPLFLAEQVTFACRLRALTFIPWVTRKDAPGGFLLSGGPWTDRVAATHASRSESRCDYIVTTHLKSTEGSWCVELRLVRTSDAECLGTLSTSLNFSQPQDTIPEFAGQLLQLLSTKAGVRMHTPPPAYQVPNGVGFACYLLRLEQLLAVRWDRSEPSSSSFLHGKREILDGNIQLCVEQPRNVTVRILLANTFLAMKRIDPQILPEFKERVALLQKEMPLPEHAHNIIQSLLDEAFAG